MLQATKTESKNMMLVYASEKAMDFEVKTLPPNLEVCDLLLDLIVSLLTFH